MGVLARHFLKSDSDAIIDLKAIERKSKEFELLPDADKQQAIKGYLDPVAQPFITPLTRITLPAIAQMIELFQQATNFDWQAMMKTIDGGPGLLDLSPLRRLDNMSADRANGICPVPMYEFDEKTWELFAGAGHPDDVREYLKGAGIFPLFFPPPDQLALQVIDRGLKDPNQVVELIEASPFLGHPLGSTEIVPSQSSIPHVLEELRNIGYVAEGEHGVEITPTGTITRSVIKVRPHEGIFHRPLNRLSLNVSVSPRDFMH